MPSSGSHPSLSKTIRQTVNSLSQTVAMDESNFRQNQRASQRRSDFSPVLSSNVSSIFYLFRQNLSLALVKVKPQQLDRQSFRLLQCALKKWEEGLPIKTWGLLPHRWCLSNNFKALRDSSLLPLHSQIRRLRISTSLRLNPPTTAKQTKASQANRHRLLESIR